MKTVFCPAPTLRMGTVNVMRCMALAGAQQAADTQCHFARCEGRESLITLTTVGVGALVDANA